MIASGEIGDHDGDIKQKAVQEMLGRLNLQANKVYICAFFIWFFYYVIPNLILVFVNVNNIIL